MKYARRRDVVEPSIVRALERAGASVQRLDATGAPDLLVGFGGETFLLEVKDEHGKHKRGGKRTDSGLRETQELWWSRWRGAPPLIVTNASEALRAVMKRPIQQSEVRRGDTECAPLSQSTPAGKGLDV